MKKTFLTSLALITSTIIILGFFVISKTYSQDVVRLTISPPTQEIYVKPGLETRFQVKFFNASSENIAGFIKVADFVVNEKDGAPNLLFYDVESNRYSAKKWLTPLEDRVNIAANTPFTATILVKVPKDITGCGHYAAVYFQPQPAGISDKATASQVSFKLASLVSFITENQKCLEKAYLNKISAPSFLEYGPIPVTVEVLNRSDYHISPQGYLALINPLTNQQEEVKTLPQVNIFPDAIREYKLELGKKLMLGRYKIDFNAGFGKTGQTIKGSTYVWVFPWRIVLVVTLTFIIIIILTSQFYKKITQKEQLLEKELEEERKEIEELKKQLKKKDE